MKAFWLVLAIISAARYPQQIEPFRQSPTEHMITVVEKPFQVRSVRGCIAKKQGDLGPLPGATVEVRGPATNGKVKGVVTNERGCFRIDHLPEGTYEFKVTLNGFQSVEGMIVVSRRASRHGQVRIEMLLGV